VRVFYGTEKREGERLEIYTGGISPCSRDRVSDVTSCTSVTGFEEGHVSDFV